LEGLTREAVGLQPVSNLQDMERADLAGHRKERFEK
jgi:hypothetical protein